MTNPYSLPFQLCWSCTAASRGKNRGCWGGGKRGEEKHAYLNLSNEKRKEKKTRTWGGGGGREGISSTYYSNLGEKKKKERGKKPKLIQSVISLKKKDSP